MKKILLISVMSIIANALPASTPMAQSTSSLADTPPLKNSSVGLEEEFYGPFSSWADLKQDYGATGDGIADDTAALQKALNDLGATGKKNVLYIPAGTYRITKTLTGVGKFAVSILGEHPEKVTLRWDGKNGGTMFNINLTYSLISRITFDGAGKANVLLLSYFLSGKKNFLFPTLNEFGDNVFKDAKTCLQIGKYSGGDDKTSVLRSSFYRCERATAVNDPNAVQMFVRDSYFENNGVGVTNSPGAGGFHVYSSVFKGSKVADIHIDNSSLFGIRDNYSQGSAVFFLAESRGDGAQMTIQGNTILDPTDRAILIKNRGPLMFIDNTIKNAKDNTTKPVFLNSTSQSDLISVGNTYTLNNPLDIIPSNGNTNTVFTRVRSIQDKIVSPSSINVTEPPRLATPAVKNRQVFALKAGATGKEIQAAINAAIASGVERPIVFLPTGSYQVSESLVIPANTDLQLVGDGLNATYLVWSGTDTEGIGSLLKVQGPTHVTIRDFTLKGLTMVNNLLSIENVDQPNAQLMMRQVLTDGDYLTDTGLSLEGLDNLFIHALGSSFHGPKYSIKASGGPSTAAGEATTARFVQTGGNTVIMVYATALVAQAGDGLLLTNGAKVLIRDNWLDSAYGAFLNLGKQNSGNLTVQGYYAYVSALGGSSNFTIDDFDGRIALFGGNFPRLPNSAFTINPSSPKTNLLFAGQFFPSQIYTVTGSASNVGFISNQVFDPRNIVGKQEWNSLLDDSGRTDDQFFLKMLEQARADTARTPILSTDPNTTSLSIIRVTTLNGINAIRVAH